MIATPPGDWFYGREVKADGKARVSPAELSANWGAIRARVGAARAAVRFEVPVRRGGAAGAAGAAAEEDYADILRREPEAIEVADELRAGGRAAEEELSVDGTHP